MSRKPAPEPPAKLIALMKDGKVVPFVGAGFSRAAQRKKPTPGGFHGMPTYAELLGRLLELAQIEPADEAVTREYLEHQEYDQAADALRAAVTEVPFYLMMREILEPVDQGIEGSLGFRRILTTNYDRLLEGFTAPRHEVITPADEKAFLLFMTDTQRGYILKLHGDITRPDTIPWGRVALLRYYGYDSDNQPLPNLPRLTHNLRAFLERLFAESSVLFLGSALAPSEGYAQILRDLARDWGGSLPYPHYALVPYDPALAALRAEVSRSMNLRYLYYEPDATHSQVWEFLSLLKAGRPSAPILPGEEWEQWYHHRERPDYLRAQLERERTATSVRYLTPNLTNAVTTAESLAVDCREDLTGRYEPEVVEAILAAMRERASNLDRRLREEGLEVRVLCLETELRKALDPAQDRAKLSRTIARYQHLLDLTATTDTEVRVIPGLTSEDLKAREASFALIFNRNGEQSMADVTIAYSSQATNDFPEIHRVYINSPEIWRYTFTFERFWVAARNEAETESLLRSLLEQARGAL
jgi:hypothetical protein